MGGARGTSVFAARKPLTLSQACCNRVRCFCWCWCWCSFVTHVWTDTKFHVVSQDEKRGKNPAKTWTTRRLRARGVRENDKPPSPPHQAYRFPTYILETSTTAMPPSAMDTPVFRRLRSRSSSARDERGTPSGRRTLRSGRRSWIPFPSSYIHICVLPHTRRRHVFSESASYSHTCSLAKGRGRQHNTSYLLRIITLFLSTTHHHRLVPESHCGLD